MEHSPVAVYVNGHLGPDNFDPIHALPEVYVRGATPTTRIRVGHNRISYIIGAEAIPEGVALQVLPGLLNHILGEYRVDQKQKSEYCEYEAFHESRA